MGHFIAALLGKLCADEVKAWLPPVAERITKWAVRCLPKELKERYSEEWRSHLNDVPGSLTKVWVACGFLSAATQISSRIAAFWLFLIFLPAIAFVRLIRYLNERKMYTFPLTLMNEYVRDMETGMREYVRGLGYPANERVRLEIWVKSREIPLGRLLHESLNLDSPLSRIYSRGAHYAFWRPSLLYSLSEYAAAARLDHLLVLTSVMSGDMPLRDWYESAIEQPATGQVPRTVSMKIVEVKKQGSKRVCKWRCLSIK